MIQEVTPKNWRLGITLNEKVEETSPSEEKAYR